MDKRIFLNAVKHLHAAKPCVPSPVCAVTPTGIKAAERVEMWISRHLCHNYPQFYAEQRISAKNGHYRKRNKRKQLIF